MKKKVFFGIITAMVILFTQNMAAQVRIGSSDLPNEDALLDLTEDGSNPSKGVLMPRVKLESTEFSPQKSFVEGMMVYNTARTTRNDDTDVTPGFYYSDGTEWKRLPFMSEGEWFYLPSQDIDISEEDAVADLYEIYLINIFNPLVSSEGADVSPVSNVYAAEDLEYYVMQASDAFYNIQITKKGLLTMKVDQEKLKTAPSYINIAVRVK